MLRAKVYARALFASQKRERERMYLTPNAKVQTKRSATPSFQRTPFVDITRYDDKNVTRLELRTKPPRICQKSKSRAQEPLEQGKRCGRVPAGSHEKQQARGDAFIFFSNGGDQPHGSNRRRHRGPSPPRLGLLATKRPVSGPTVRVPGSCFI
jgi:hypothetical protein